MNNKDTLQQTHSIPSGNHRIWAAISLVASAIIAALTFTLAYNAQTGYLVGKIASILLVSAILIELAISLILVRTNRIYINDRKRTTLLRVATLILHLAVDIAPCRCILRRYGSHRKQEYDILDRFAQKYRQG